MDTIWKDMFVLSLPVLEKIFRPILVYAFLVIGLRLAGKRELGSLNPFDLVVLLTISNTVQNAIIGADNSLIGGLIGAATLLIVNNLVVRYMHKNRKLEKFIEGEESNLIIHGHIQYVTMTNEGVDQSELEIAAHKQGFSSLNEVETAILEPGGSISFKGKEMTPTEKRQRELLERITNLEHKIDTLNGKLARS